jgi:DNA-directed RNA polymerase specialized sigma24 family protein
MRDLAVIADAGPPSTADRDADRFIAELYAREGRSLTRLAVLLVVDSPTAEQVVRDAFVAVYRGWRRLRDGEKALAHLRRAVISESRSARRNRMVAGGNGLTAGPGGHGSVGLVERSALVTALRGLPARQREAIVLRYYAGLSETEVAAAMRVRRRMVTGCIGQGMSSLRAVLEQQMPEGGAQPGA